MSINDRPMLVAPRPVRLASAPTSFHTYPTARRPSVSGTDDGANAKHPQQHALLEIARAMSTSPGERGRTSVSPSLSPDPSALEEFLSILRPTLFHPQPSSPVLRARRTLPFYRPHIELVTPPAPGEEDGKWSVSPVSRYHTRNPLARRTPPPLALSPCAVPLPPPTPSELASNTPY